MSATSSQAAPQRFGLSEAAITQIQQVLAAYPAVELAILYGSRAWYKLLDTLYDTERTAQYEGIPFKWPTPDPIWQTIHPFQGKNHQYVHPPGKQPYIHWITRLGAYAQLKGKSLEYVSEISPLIWDGKAKHCPAKAKERFKRGVADQCPYTGPGRPRRRAPDDLPG